MTNRYSGLAIITIKITNSEVEKQKTTRKGNNKKEKRKQKKRKRYKHRAGRMKQEETN